MNEKEKEVPQRVYTLVEFFEEKMKEYDEREKEQSFLSKWWPPILWCLISLFLLI